MNKLLYEFKGGKYMLNKKLERLVEQLLGSAAAKPHATVAKGADIMEPKIENKDVYTSDQHSQAEEVKEVIVEGAKTKIVAGHIKLVPHDHATAKGKEVRKALIKEEEMPVAVEVPAAEAEHTEVAPASDEEVDAVIAQSQAKEAHADDSEYNEEGSMAKTQLRIILDAAEELHEMLGDHENLPEWVQSKLTLATEYIDTVRDYLKSEAQGEVYSKEELMEAFEALGLDTKKYTFEYLAEELGFAAAKPVATSEAPAKTLTPSATHKDVFPSDESKSSEDLKPVLVESQRGRPSNKAKRLAPKGSTVMGPEGKLETIKKLQKK
jgi:hypothetical protein